MKKLSIIISAVLFCIAMQAHTFCYDFRNINMAEALTSIAEQHPEIHINFIYNELEHYTANTRIDTDDAYDALRQTVGLNPISIINTGDRYYIEALQHGRYRYSGNVIGTDNEPVAAATVMLLSRRDSTVVTYGITDKHGIFAIPCDHKQVIAKIACMGYKTILHTCDQFNVGTVVMEITPLTLSAVKIESQGTELAPDKNTYIPSSRQKKSSQDAIDLLRRMAIPQLMISPGSNAVNDLFGNSVSVYINGQKAEETDVQGMKMTDVRKVEYIVSPVDPRFHGEERVVNFIVQEYEYGGYTKVSSSETFLNGFSSNLNVFSRFTVKKFTYDIFAGSVNKNQHNNGSDTRARYTLTDGDNTEIIDRTELCTASHHRSAELPISFRATYRTERFTMRNSLFYTHNSTPRNDMSGSLDLSRRYGENYEFHRSNPSMYNNFYYHGDFRGLVGKDISIDITPSFNYTHRSNRSDYCSTASSPINNRIKEDAYNWGVQSSGSKSIGQNQNILLNFTVGQVINRLRYSNSSNNFNSLSNLFLGGLVRYVLHTAKYSFGVTLGLANEHVCMNGTIYNDIYPHANLNGSISLNKKNQLSCHLAYQTSSPSISLRSNDIVQNNEIMYLTGNPNLHNVREIRSNIAYNFAHNNALSLALFAGIDNDFNRIAATYRPYKDGQALLRDFINNGNYLRIYDGIAINYKLLDNSLQLYANIAQNFYRTTGIYKTDISPVRIQLQATYYWKSFNMQAYWVNREKKLTENSNIIVRGRDSYGLSIGWGNGIWNINFSARNIFRKGWQSSTWYKGTPLYTESQTYYNPWVHANLNLSITYTVGYGKKIRRGNEIGGGNTAPSAILE